MMISLYKRIGEDEGVKSLVDRFYDLMEQDPLVKELREIHAPDLTEAREKLYLFLCGWLGGPQRFVERYGPPMLRARHLPFSIGKRERDQWMRCMAAALSDAGLPEEIHTHLLQAFSRLADHMRNQPEEETL